MLLLLSGMAGRIKKYVQPEVLILAISGSCKAQVQSVISNSDQGIQAFIT